MINIIIADDHKVILDGFVSIIKGTDNISVIATAENGEQVLQLLEENSVDLVLLDINMPILNGVETCKLISKKFPKTKVIALSMFKKSSYVKRMRQNGASGYLLKNDSSEEILEAIEQVHAGKEYYSVALRENLVENIFENRKADLISITDREGEVLFYISEGFSNKEICTKINLSVHTIDSHRKSLLSKFNARNTADLIKRAVDKGMI